MFRLTKSLAVLSAAAMLSAAPAAVLAQEEPGAGTTINMAQATWDTGWFHAEIYKQLFEELGYDVQGPTTLDNPPFYQAVAQGDVDLWVNGWFPLHNTYQSTFEGQAEIIGAVAEGGALEGYLVDKASVEEFDIQSLEDFKRPEVKEAFDRDGDGRADLVACPPGWGCEINIEHHLDAYELRDHVNPIKASYSASMADAVAAYEAGEPIFFYTWTPNWTVNELVPGEDVMWIEVPEVNLPEDMADLADAAVLEGVEGCVADPCKLGFPANDIVPVANSAFLEDNPAAAKLLEVTSIPLQAIFAQNAEMNAGAGSSEDIQNQASTWIEENRDMVDGWLEEARAAAQS
ncbi:glycine betaine/L-proline ABC transporter substrate-binding protein ProX [Devosia sp. RR2S18]|jgi:glycine betaine/proline transport system substrate-binding protein|uniref:glycine betaine/L-proline ABC transporter substrate-binding protein ProX n=1 Tax=Devosia rhizosphaerae TaxID=3049774 RepID=UPI00253F72EF|nr:glycine betaine/L-proline ABC transporter substrate-binding protein ProX [Devosia sp. RR2S18]WIJ26142.1 glycine betaine/L-proline ABC transporter substrate-binding protein ProX [Devosia sp. RR2S18]HEV7291505.1 glycine betaine/L-proline ABC transporter substrate-binding protein ProX [Devosia sp.]